MTNIWDTWTESQEKEGSATFLRPVKLKELKMVEEQAVYKIKEVSKIHIETIKLT